MHYLELPTVILFKKGMLSTDNHSIYIDLSIDLFIQLEIYTYIIII